MKRFFRYLADIPLKRKIKYGIMLGCFIVAIIFFGIGNYFKNLLPDIQAEKRWDNTGGYTQFGVYLPLGLMEEVEMFNGILHQVNAALEKESIVAEDANDRVTIGAYSGYGTVSLKTEMDTVMAEAIGVGGDFFYFHPIDMIDGSYLTEDFLMQDYVILDKETAWKLFGALNVTGMTVNVGDIPFVVAGVYEPTHKILAKEAGAEDGRVFMFYSSLRKHGQISCIQWLDFLIPNPVNGFGEKILTENMTISAEDAVIVEHSARFNPILLYKLVPDYLERVMSKSGIVYPYWENMARGYENILVVFLLIETVCLVCGVVLLLHTIKPVKNIKRGLNWIIDKIRRRK